MKRVIIVTGGASGIGKEAAFKLAHQGVSVVVADINMELAEAVVKEIHAAKKEASAFHLDVSKKENIQACIEFTVERYGTLTGIFNNAGIGALAPFPELSSEEYDRMMRINLDGVFYGIQYAANKMMALGVKEGSIVNTASIYGFVGAGTSPHYNATKAAVVSLTKSAAQAYTPHGIRVTAIAPGFTDTPMVRGALDADTLKMLENAHMRGKLLSAAEVANVAVWLLGSESSAVNGSTVLADDGYLAFK